MSEAAATKVTKFPGAESPRGGEIFRAIPEVMKEVGAVGKDRKNQQQGYQFRGIDDVYAALQLVMAKHGVFVVPEVVEEHWEERATKSGGALQWVRSKIRHTFYATDGSSFYAVTYGEGMDSGDKASNKAMSCAMKYALVEVFCIPTSDPKDPEIDSPEVQPRRAAKAAPKADAWMPAGDTGEVIDGARVERVRKLFLDELKLTKKQACQHLESWFGVASPLDMTDAMGKTAELLCLAIQAGHDVYVGKVAELKTKGMLRLEAI